MTVYDLLMIDDDIDNYHALKNYAYEQQVVLKYARTLEEGMQELQTSHRILGIILDGKGLLHKGQHDHQTSAAFVHEAITQITVFERKRGKTYPKCVLTAWYDNLKESLEGRGIKIFDKKKLANDPAVKKDLFHYLTVQAKDSTEYSIRKKFQPIFLLLDEKYIQADADNAFYKACVAVESGNADPSDFTIIRQLYEMVLKSINRRDKVLLPDFLFFADGRPNYDWTLRYLAGHAISDSNRRKVAEAAPPRIPAHIHDCAYFVKEVCSALTHQYPHKFSIHSYFAAFYAWIELYSWYTNWVDEKG